MIALHPSGGTPAGFEQSSGWDRLADEHDFIVAYLGSAAPAWKSPANVSYIAAQIHALTARYDVDRRRVYVTGFSAGAYISYFVGCRLSALVAAIAPVSSGMLSQTCRLTKPVSELTIIGTQDIIPLSGTARFPSPAEMSRRWRHLDRCGGRPAKVKRVGPVTEQTWGPCAKATAVGLYVLEGGRHQYPGESGLPATDPDSKFQASEAIWEFFASSRSRPKAPTG